MVDSILWIEEKDQDRALQELVDGGMDVYMLPLRSPSAIASAKANPNLWTIDGTGGLFDLFLNPVPVNQALAPGVGNPFSKREVREAMNYLIDRDFIANEIAGGGQLPQVTLEHRFTPEYARDPVFMSELEARYRFNPPLAAQMISDALNADPDYHFELGTQRWQFKGTDISLSFVIRSEDLRRDIGNYIADQLERIGLGVNRYYTGGSGVFPMVWEPPPDSGAWQLYTEGWAATGLSAWADGDPDFYSCGGEGHPIWTMYSAPPELATACVRLRDGQYASLAEREDLFERATELSLRESVRVWTTAGSSTFVMSRRVTGMVYDLAGGPWGRLATRTARFSTTGGQLNVGVRLQFLSPWNPWQGFGWVYDTSQSHAFTDPAVWPHPHTGLYMPIRATFSVAAPGPTTSLQVPSDALTWNPATLGFQPVLLGTTARSEVTYTFTFGKWHDGSDFTMDDVLYELALAYRRANASGDVHQIDRDAAATSTILLANALRGFRVLDGTHLQAWYDYWHLDPSMVASLINPAFPATPWTASELALSTVLDDTCRISEVTAANEGKDALDLTRGRCLAAMDANIVGYFGIHRPPGLDAYITPGEASTAWTALRNFRNTTGHYFASNGPFVLRGIDEFALQTTMTVDPNYPIPADAYDRYLVPRVPEITLGPIPLVIIGLNASFSLTSRLQGVAYDEIDSSFLVLNPSTGAVLFQGKAARAAAGSYEIKLTGTQTSLLQAGAYELRTITVGNEAAIPVFVSQPFIAISDAGLILDQLRGEINRLQQSFNSQLLEQQNLTKATQAQLAGLQTLMVASLALSAVTLSVAVVALVISLRVSRRDDQKRGAG